MVADRLPQPEEIHQQFEHLQRELAVARQRILDSEERVAMLEQIVQNLRNPRKKLPRGGRSAPLNGPGGRLI